MVRKLLYIVIALTGFVSCHPVDDWNNDPVGNFEALWTIVDEHYCFFEEKGVDWQEIYRKYRPRVHDKLSSQQLFDVCASMLDELRDGHTNLSAPFNTSYYRNWWSDYPQNYDKRIVDEYYLHFDYRSVGAIDYGILEQNVGYVRYSTFSSSIGEGNLDMVLSWLASCNGLIIDVRDNGGGEMTNVGTIVSRFIRQRTLAGYISHKTGPGHDDFSEPYAYYYDPVADGHLLWNKPVVVLTNRSTFSAANNFVSVMKLVPGVKIVGATTGGGSGMPFSSELPCGWSVRFSACSILDALGNSTEDGVDPTEGCDVDLDPVAALQGIDSMLEFAIKVVNGPWD